MIDHTGKILDKINEYKLTDCQVCEFVHLSPIPNKSFLEKLYSSNYYLQQKPDYLKNAKTDINWWKTVYVDRIEKVKKYILTKNKRLVELGSGPGMFLKYARSHGWDVIGIEPSEQAFKFSKRKVRVINRFYQDVNVNELGKFGAVAMFEFLEHLADPKSSVKFANHVLEKGGVLCIGVPNDYNPLQIIAREALRLKPYWLAPPYHINYFTATSLEHLLNKCGFEVVYKETSFPLEMFLLMGDIYPGNEKLGREIHSRRMRFDIYLSKYNNKLKQELYKNLAKMNIGRDLTIFARKIKNENN